MHDNGVTGIHYMGASGFVVTSDDRDFRAAGIAYPVVAKPLLTHGE
jgi:hypothetical protein